MIDMSEIYNHADYSGALDSFNKSSLKKRWSEFKSVHLEVAKHKCPICECSLKEGELLERDSSRSKVELQATMDHYRPADETLYRFLQYEHTNYILMCLDCNNSYKGNLFPLHSSTPDRARNAADLASENPLIVNPIEDDLLALFTLVFRYTPSGKKVLELTARSDDAYLKEKAEETIKVFSLGDCEVNVHESVNVQTCRISLLNDHFKKFYEFVEAIKNNNLNRAIAERNRYDLQDYGFYKFIICKQYSNLI